MLHFTVEKDELTHGIVLGERRIDLPQQLVAGGGWAGIVLTAHSPAQLLDQGLVGRHVWTSAPAEFVSESLRVGDCEARLPPRQLAFLHGCKVLLFQSGRDAAIVHRLETCRSRVCLGVS